jgi:transposase
MAFPKRFVIEEDLTTLRKALQCSRNEMTRKRLRTLIIYKQHEEEGISKNQVAARTGIDPASALKWRNAYIEGGLSGLLSHGRKSNRNGAISPDQREALRAKLHDPQNGLRGYTELLEWFNGQFGTQLKYHAMNKYVKRNFGAQCKVARKSHVKKDPDAVAAFKKTSGDSARS